MGLLKLKEIMDDSIVKHSNRGKAASEGDEEVGATSERRFSFEPEPIEVEKLSAPTFIPLPDVARSYKRKKREDLDEINSRLDSLKVGQCVIFSLEGYSDERKEQIRAALSNCASAVTKERHGKRRFTCRYLRNGLDGESGPVFGVWRIL